MTVKLSTGRTFTFENIRGADGKDGISPKIRINAETGLWEISEDDGENWTSTAVSALGTKGDKGDTGDRGEKGDKGDQGEQGIQGIQGEKGDKGEQGIQGIQGEKGKDGVSPKIKINPITNEWEISTDNGLTYVSTEIKATGAKGEKGDKGDQGEQGIQGIQGEKGEKGDTGATGAAGAKGEKGDKGDTGAQGEQGMQGIQGIQGAQGEKGEKGEKGDKGADGVSVTGVTINEDNKLVITLSEGNPIIIDKSVVGADGKDGNGISKVTLTEDFCLVFNYTDGTSSDKIGPIKGADGANGIDGLTPILTLSESGDLSVKYGENGTVTLLGNIKGIKGDKGDAGENGKDGRGIDDVKITDGYLYIKYSDESDYKKIGAVKDDESIYGNLGSPLKFILLEDGTYGVKAGATAGNYSSLIIPSEYQGLEVTQILDKGFSELNFLEEITIPESIKVIGEEAFYNCFSLKNAVIPEGVTEIKEKTFYNCSDLSGLTLPTTLEEIERYAFDGVTSLMPENITYNGNIIFLSVYKFNTTGYNPKVTRYKKNSDGTYKVDAEGIELYGNSNYYVYIDDSEELKKMISGNKFIAKCNREGKYSTDYYYYKVFSKRDSNWQKSWTK